jgi:hypothetical protein
MKALSLSRNLTKSKLVSTLRIENNFYFIKSYNFASDPMKSKEVAEEKFFFDKEESNTYIFNILI